MDFSSENFKVRCYYSVGGTAGSKEPEGSTKQQKTIISAR